MSATTTTTATRRLALVAAGLGLGACATGRGPAMALPSGDVTQAITAIEHAWNAADVSKDRAFFERLYAADFVDTDSDGKLLSRAQAMTADSEPSDISYERIDLEDIRVLANGPMAIAVGRNTGRGRDKTGPLLRTWTFTDAFVWRDGRWQCLTTHSKTVKREKL